jgi:hypothetical protein
MTDSTEAADAERHRARRPSMRHRREWCHIFADRPDVDPVPRPSRLPANPRSVNGAAAPHAWGCREAPRISQSEARREAGMLTRSSRRADAHPKAAYRRVR